MGFNLTLLNDRLIKIKTAQNTQVHCSVFFRERQSITGALKKESH